jgi:hypothetical protein
VWLARPFLFVLVALAGVGYPAAARAEEWVQNFVATPLWSGPDAGAISFGTAPQWDYFQVVQPAPPTRVHVLVVRTKNYAFVDAANVGPSGQPPVGWPATPSTAGAPASTLPPATPPEQATAAPSQPAIGPVPGFRIQADLGLWPAFQVLQSIRHTWTLEALSSTGTRVEFGELIADAAGLYEPRRGVITINSRWAKSDARALAAILEHEAKHVADVLAGLDVYSPSGCLTTEVNAFREEAKTWGELVGPNGKPDPQDELERSLNFKLSLLQRSPDALQSLITQNAGYRTQCQIR